jgi:hypothetical protein
MTRIFPNVDLSVLIFELVYLNKHHDNIYRHSLRRTPYVYHGEKYILYVHACYIIHEVLI